MSIEIKRISKECVRPSSPTPSHLKTYKISLLDQFMLATGIPMILYHSNHRTNLPIGEVISKRSLVLRQSLSETLTLFYPLAGTVKDNLSIQCNDEVHYIEARANKPPLHVCSHMIMDGTAMASFLKAWAATASSKSSTGTISPNFDAPSLFPQHGVFPKEATAMALCEPFIRTGKLAIQRLVFEASAIASLKAQATSSSMKNPTRVEVVSAFLSKRITAMLQAKSIIYHGPIIFAHAVNLRRRALPHSQKLQWENLFGWHISLVCKMREAIRKIDSNFAKNIQGDGGIITVYDRVKEIGRAFSSAVDYVTISSWCNFGLYDVDFGWGKPMWVSGVGLSDDSTTQFLNKVVLMDARMEKGIEAWLLLGEGDIAILEKDKELFAFASLNPSPFN
ncbi:hypothetical protein P3X46_001281 [Hevea brasiliensis]|uniref:Uncharacterized protein n=1 Tax=Hevea brasiliensis TaxID=3981 RepID=A0ABQ9NG25_HEVBR|nr:hypothetical protein P3X46_001281 [Hevea brasiliensis]